MWQKCPACVTHRLSDCIVHRLCACVCVYVFVCVYACVCVCVQCGGCVLISKSPAAPCHFRYLIRVLYCIPYVGLIGVHFLAICRVSVYTAISSFLGSYFQRSWSRSCIQLAISSQLFWGASWPVVINSHRVFFSPSIIFSRCNSRRGSGTFAHYLLVYSAYYLELRVIILVLVPRTSAWVVLRVRVCAVIVSLKSIWKVLVGPVGAQENVCFHLSVLFGPMMGLWLEGTDCIFPYSWWLFLLVGFGVYTRP